jgi:hypothetical protein
MGGYEDDIQLFDWYGDNIQLLDGCEDNRPLLDGRGTIDSY